ncbi:MAG: copper amine oxidase N-terminal domain-containing protein [Selenomonadales bacterium]|nr:copper amine oxidase N-terminal domain-containing protein [Selenomonadales bacterium]
MKKTIAMMITSVLLCGGSVFAQAVIDNKIEEAPAVVTEAAEVQAVEQAAVTGKTLPAVLPTSIEDVQPTEAVEEQRVVRLLSTVGVIDEINDNHFVIKGNDDQMTVELNINDDTYLLNGVTGEILTWDMLSTGDDVTAYYSPALTRSIPPQGQAIALVIGKETRRGIFVNVQRVISEDSLGLTFLNQNEDMEILIPTDDRGQIPNIKAGMNLLVWGDTMTMSIPAKMTATRSQVLPDTFDMRLDKEAGKVWIHGKEAGNIVIKDDTTFLSLRDAAEALGYKTEWHDSGVIVVSRGAEYYAMQIGSKDYSKQKMRVQLHDVPQMIDGITYVPVTVFSQLLGLRIADFSY